MLKRGGGVAAAQIVVSRAMLSTAGPFAIQPIYPALAARFASNCLLQDTVQPEAIQAGLMDNDNQEGMPVRACVLSRSLPRCCRSPETSPLRIECLDIFSPVPGESEVTS